MELVLAAVIGAALGICAGAFATVCLTVWMTNHQDRVRCAPSCIHFHMAAGRPS